MKCKRSVLLILVFGLVLAFAAGCGGQNQPDAKTLVVGAVPTPHAEILELVKDDLKAKGINLEIKEFTDYVTPNIALNDGDLDANYFQHVPYMEDFEQKNNMDLTAVVGIHFEPMGLYSKKITSLDQLEEGAQIGVPNDVTNEARALLLLQDNGLITLKEGVGLNATKRDIVDNPKNLDIVELEAAQIPRALPDLAAAIINGNYAIEAGLKVKDTIIVEDKNSLAAQTFANVIAVRAGDENRDEIKALAEVLTTEKVRKFIEDTYEGAVVPVF